MTPQETIEAGKLMIAYGKSVTAGKPLELQVNSGDKWEDMTGPPRWSWDANTYRVKAVLRRVPLGAEDVPPGSTIRSKQWNAWKWTWVRPLTDSTAFSDSDGAITFQELFDSWEINRNDGKGWVPCWKEEV